MSEPLTYPETILPNDRYQYCPMCRSPLVRKVLFDDHIPLVTCPACQWICTRSNLCAAVSVVTTQGGIVTILSPGLPAESPAALPAGLVEYGKSPEEAALREIREEAGLEAEITRSLGWYFHRNFDGWPGPWFISCSLPVRSAASCAAATRAKRASTLWKPSWVLSHPAGQAAGARSMYIWVNYRMDDKTIAWVVDARWELEELRSLASPPLPR